MRPEWFSKGRIIKCPFDYPRDKKKFAVILGRDYPNKQLIVVMINSEISQQSYKDDEIVSLQVEISKQNYPNVITNRSGISYIDCARIRKKNYDELVLDFADNIAKDFGQLTDDDWNIVFNAVLRNSNLKKRDERNIKSIL